MKALRLIDHLGTELRLRVTADRLFRIIENELINSTDIELDFLSIEFMSRAFADQFIKGTNQLKIEGKKKILLKNVPFSIQSLLETVQKTQKVRLVPESRIQNYRFESVEDMKDFMYSW